MWIKKGLRVISMFLFLSVQAYQAVIKVPVVDCFCFPMPDDFAGPTVTTDDDAPLIDRARKNPRECQLLFNELVEVIGSQGDYLLVELPNSLCYNRKLDRIECVVWVHKNAVLPVSIVEQNAISLTSIAPAIHFSFKSLAHCSENVLTLTMPFNDPVTGQIYSAGTRFVRKAELDTDDAYAVMIIDTKSIELKISYVPITSAHLYQEKSLQELIADFVKLIQKWAHQEPRWLPYVWGGGSFVYTIDEEKIHPSAVFCGYDCSSLILRAAQTSGIPYCLRDSTTINKVFKPIEDASLLQDGDIIWFPGHVMIITCVEQNLLAQARGYGSGYGKLYESALNTMFQGITSYSDLMAAYQKHQPLNLLNWQGLIHKQITEFKIFSLSQIWQK